MQPNNQNQFAQQLYNLFSALQKQGNNIIPTAHAQSDETPQQAPEQPQQNLFDQLKMLLNNIGNAPGNINDGLNRAAGADEKTVQKYRLNQPQTTQTSPSPQPQIPTSNQQTPGMLDYLFKAFDTTPQQVVNNLPIHVNFERGDQRRQELVNQVQQLLNGVKDNYEKNSPLAPALEGRYSEILPRLGQSAYRSADYLLQHPENVMAPGGDMAEVTPFTSLLKPPTPKPPVISDTAITTPDKLIQKVQAPNQYLKMIKDNGWASDQVKSQFDIAMLNKDRETVQRMLPQVPDYYKQRFADNIGSIVKQPPKPMITNIGNQWTPPTR